MCCCNNSWGNAGGAFGEQASGSVTEYIPVTITYAVTPGSVNTRTGNNDGTDGGRSGWRSGRNRCGCCCR